MKQTNLIQVESENAPVVELDSSAHAAYIRFSKKAVADTRVVEERRCVVTIDMDSNGKVVGIELVGVKEFGIEPLLKMARVFAPKRILDRTSYVPAKLQPA
jgi:uncharacterized protein YuzE